MQSDNSGATTWEESSVANLYRYAPTGVYYARPRIKGKAKVKCLKTDKLTVAKLRLGDFLKEEHRKAESIDNTVRGKVTFGDAIEVSKTRLEADKALKPRSKDHLLERLSTTHNTYLTRFSAVTGSSPCRGIIRANGTEYDFTSNK